MWQALWDPRFNFDFGSGCATSAWTTYGTYARRCCYNFYASYFYFYYFWWWWSPWSRLGLGFLDTSQTFQSGSLLQYNPYLYPQLYNQYDYLPKQWCCLQSNLCNLYYNVRPHDYCYFYFMPFFGFMFGDPHLTTPDGKNYTFNGWGEYWMVKADNILYLQCRTDRALDSAGHPSNATVFTAFAAQGFTNSTTDNATTFTPSDRLFIGLDLTKTSIIIRLNDDTDLTSWFDTLPDGSSSTRQGVTIGRKNTSFVAKFSSGISMEVEYGYQSLSISTVIPQTFIGNKAFKGLLGNIDGNPNNDFLNSSGTTLSSTSSEKDIFFYFGQSWFLQDTSETLFYYNYSNGENFTSFQHPDFVPDFVSDYTNTQLYSDATGYCSRNGGQVDETCRSDYVYTNGNTGVANSSYNSNNAYQSTSYDLGRSTVHILVDNRLTNWTVNMTQSIYIYMSSSNSSDTLYLAKESTIGNLTNFNSTTWKFTWTPYDLTPVNFTFNGSDASGSIAAPLNLTVRLCGCENNGTCQWDVLQTQYNNTDAFQIVSCVCPENMFEGMFCETPYNACRSDPCGPHANCTLTDTDPGFTCGSCLPGYALTPGYYKCEDIDECNQTNTNNCSSSTQTCVNTDGGYNCTCKTGFFQNGSICQDIDECALRLDNCTQLCNNTYGGFVCSCYEGYNLTNGTVCTGSSSWNCSCDFCVTSNNTNVCDCNRGYAANPNGTSCIAIDYCNSTQNPCGANSYCNNTNGTYSCSCQAGYTLQNARFCQTCPSGTWGLNCTQICQCSAVNCSSTNGCIACANPGFTGGNCTVDVNECNNTSICYPNSHCNNTYGSYQCICNDWFSAMPGNCQLLDACVYNVTVSQSVQALGIVRCQNNGFCTNGNITAGNWACVCPAGYTGRHCETVIDNCANNTQCMNGAQCVNVVGLNTFNCNCTDNHYGSFCQNNGTTTPASTTTQPICSPNCTIYGCNVTGSGKCDQCDPGFGLNNDSACEACGMNCENCTYVGNNTICFSCYPGYQLSSDGTNCMRTTSSTSSGTTQSTTTATTGTTQSTTSGATSATSTGSAQSTATGSANSTVSVTQNATTTTISPAIKAATYSLATIMGVVGAATLALGGILLITRACPLWSSSGALTNAAAPAEVAEKAPDIFSRFAQFPEMPRRYWSPSYLQDIEAPRPQPEPVRWIYPRPPQPQQPEPIRMAYDRPRQPDMPVQWNVLRNYQRTRGSPFNNYRAGPYTNPYAYPY